MHKKIIVNKKIKWYNLHKKKGGDFLKLRGLDFRAMQSANQAREARNAYARAWRAKNRDKVRKYNETYWQKKAAAQNGEAATTEGR